MSGHHSEEHIYIYLCFINLITFKTNIEISIRK